jgi:long-chain acyl-CoA synthetase
VTGIAARARATPDAVALLSPGATRTYGDLDARQRALVGALLESGVGPGERVAVLSANRIESLEVTIACLRAGIVPVPVNRLLTPPEVSYILEDSQARWLFTDQPFETLQVATVVTFGDAFERLLHEAPLATLGDNARTRPMHYTSGTTGKPKGVWVEPYGDDEAKRRSESFRELWDIGEEDVHLVCSPLAHSAPHRFALRTLEAGGRVVLQGRFDAAETIAAIDLFTVTTTFMVPTHLARIFAVGERALARHDLSSMRMLIHAGAPIREPIKREAIDSFPPDSVWEFYGSTEGQATRISSREWLERPGSVGRALPGVRLIVRTEEGTYAPPGEPGLIWIEDDDAERFRYWGDDAKTKMAWRDGAFTVGDLGYVDDDGYLFLTGRRDDTIISGGVNVYPVEVESVLAQHPAVREVMVYGEPHEEWGQQVRALVVARPEMPLDPELLRSWARERLAGFKCPREIELVDELPRNATGKLRRPRLEEDAR